MDFIPDLPVSEGLNNILVIVDKLTKYAIFIPCSTTITEEETAKLFFKHVITKFGIPRQVITDRDTRWRHGFWEEVCRLMGMKCALTTAYHPQADGQTEIVNQGLEITLRAYIGPSRDDWTKHLDGIALAYNSTPHTSTGFSPAYLLRGYTPMTAANILGGQKSIPRPLMGNNETNMRSTELMEDIRNTPQVLHEGAQAMMDEFEANRTRAKEALLLSQVYQRRAYNNGRLTDEFEEGDLVVLNPHNLNLLREEKGRGRKLLMRYDGPFEIIRKLSPITYQLRLLASYGIHPILNIAHLERYNRSPPTFGERDFKTLNRADFDQVPEYELERIVGQRLRKVKNRRIQEWKVRWKGYGPEWDEWKTRYKLKNAPHLLEAWETDRRHVTETRGDENAVSITTQ